MTTSTLDRSVGARLVRTWLITALVDAIFSSVLNAVFYRSTVARLWEGVASVLVGPQAINGGTPMVALGLLLHVCVAFTWSAVFLLLVLRMAWVRRLVEKPFGVITVASLYGPCIWLVMSFLVIAPMTARLPPIGFRWWVQLLGHIPFVAFPIVASATARR